MGKKEEKKHIGRPSAFNDEKILDKRISIWISHFYRKLPYWELTKEYDVSMSTVRKSIEWVQKNFIKIPTKTILQGALFAIRERIKRLTTLLEKELERPQPSTRSIVELNREIREEQRDEMKLQEIYQDKYSIEVESSGSIREILKIISDKKEGKK